MQIPKCLGGHRRQLDIILSQIIIWHEEDDDILFGKILELMCNFNRDLQFALIRRCKSDKQVARPMGEQSLRPGRNKARGRAPPELSSWARAIGRREQSANIGL